MKPNLQFHSVDVFSEAKMRTVISLIIRCVVVFGRIVSRRESLLLQVIDGVDIQIDSVPKTTSCSLRQQLRRMTSDSCDSPFFNVCNRGVDLIC